MNGNAKSDHWTNPGQSGQSLVEFSLVIGFVMLVFVSMIQMILLMYAYSTLANAAKEGARYAVVHGTGNSPSGCSGPGKSSPPAQTCSPGGTTSVVTAVLNFGALSFQNINSSNVTVDYDPNSANSNNPNFGGACSAPGCLVRVTVTHVYTPLFGLGWPNFTLYAAADGRIMN